MTLREPHTLSHTGILDSLALHQSLPRPAYEANYQPTYPDPHDLIMAIHELRHTTPVTTPAQIDQLQADLSAVVLGEVERPVILDGRCAEPVDARQPVSSLVRDAERSRSITLSAVPDAIVIQRNRGQNTKPRSRATETVNGLEVTSYLGDAVNGQHPSQREPQPSRMVSAALQARDLEAGLSAAVGGHVPAAHEALLLPYERPFLANGYLLSADLPWIGKRTNALDGEHVKLLAGVQNPVGVKIGPDSDPTHIAGLDQRLNPDGVPGKLVMMLRVGLGNAALRPIVHSIARHAPQAMLMYDIHGVTKSISGNKIRAVEDITAEVAELAAVCGEAGLKLHGLHLETIMDDSRLECVDRADQTPTHPGGVDPQLNPEQKQRVLEATAGYLL